MALHPGTLLGPYEIRGPIGAGGMGEVYRARDTRLGREVAVKVLPSSFSSDAERLRRFEQEARAAGMLNHPNIVAIYDVGTHEGSPYVVSELLEGETLRKRLEEGALPPRKVLEYALQIAGGLAAAHDRAIVHRDLKPENLFVTTDGRIKILDFGLAKLTPPELEAETPTDAPTQDTEPGVTLGTVGYMSPEQVRSQKVDHCSDIFSFGTVLYEMLSGKHPFRRKTRADTMSAILKEEPAELSMDWDIPPGLERLVRRCLEKKPEERFQSARDVGFALEALSGFSSASTALAASGVARLKSRASLAWILAGVSILLGALALIVTLADFDRAPADTRTLRLFLVPPEKATFDRFSLSPDGDRLAFTATDSSGKTLLWVRRLDSMVAQVMPGTEDAGFPFWSPDGRSIGFFADGKLKKIDVSGGPPQTLCDAQNGRGGAWNRQGLIVFAPGIRQPLYQVYESGGTPTPLTILDASRQERGHRWPCFLPDGRHFLYLAWSRQLANNAIFIGSLDSSERRKLLSTGMSAKYAPPGYLLFSRDDALMAQPFNPESLQLTGQARPVAEQLPYFVGGLAYFSVSETGVLAHRSSGTGKPQLIWFDRGGKPIARLAGPPGLYRDPEISPDGSRVTVARTDPQTGLPDIWIMEVAGDVSSRFTFHPGGAQLPLWSHDGSRIVFVVDRFLFYLKASSGAGGEQLLLESKTEQNPTDWSRDGRFLLYETLDPRTKWDVWALPLQGGKPPFPLLQKESNERQARLSPNRRGIAYTSDESGRDEVYVESFPATGSRWQVSTAFGSQPRWRRDGKELFYLAGDARLMVVPVQADSSVFRFGLPRALFETRIARSSYRCEYAVTADGQRFLVNTIDEEEFSAPIAVVVNWTSQLSK